MSQWQPLWDSLPVDLRRKAGQCAKIVWSVIGKVYINELDHWWHEANLSYIPSVSPSDPTPQALVLNCIEGEPDQPVQKAHYVVDILRRRVKVCWPEIRYEPIPEQCLEIVDELEQWVRGIPARAEAARRDVAARMEEIRKKELERKLEAFAAYEERLKTSTGLNRAPTSPPQGCCLVCGVKLEPCKRCGINSCPKEGCRGGGDDNIRNCAIHTTQFCCGACRSSADWRDRHLATCPHCTRTLCVDDLIWCTGAINQSSPLHEPKVLSCKSCDATNTVGRVCANTGCPKRGLRGFAAEAETCEIRTCVECANHGIECPRHPDTEWWCNSCSHMGSPICPTCGERKCREDIYSQCDCGTIDSCRTCRSRARWNPDDFASDEEEPEYKDTVAIRTFRHIECPGCYWDARMCKGCISKEMTDCDRCCDWYCQECIESVTCFDCGEVKGCRGCIEQGCPECDMPSLRETWEEAANYDYDDY
ncbi:hypothetical protein JAAARDRAFT_401925 [Jaapia argillacea MUCL 33604]|uniref:Uncharacterized protein n=1 Tax=Jaapia argillacea MUCL 33604 TaxID=933084 RepID=A0A067PWI0_9AGAM|nr:hypothetical protein JAAARDRAFT_401925 [Jaapia argillacea MUCL 33604]